MRSKVSPKKVRVGLKWRQELSKIGLGVSLGGSNEMKETSHFLGLRGRHQYSNQRFNQNRAHCVASTAVGTEGEKDQMSRLSA